MIVVTAGAAMNILIGIVLMFVVVVQQPVFTSTTIAEFADGALTEQAGLQVGDTFYSIDGYRTYTARDVTFALSMADANDVTMTMVRDGEKVTFDHVALKSNVVERKLWELFYRTRLPTRFLIPEWCGEVCGLWLPDKWDWSSSPVQSVRHR